MALGFAPFMLWPVLFLALPIFYQLVRRAESARAACSVAFLFGYGYFMAGTWWISNALLVDAEKFGWMVPLSVLGLSAVLALWFVPLGWAAFRWRARMQPLLFAALWVLVEYARSYGIFGFPWNLLGYVALAVLPVAQLAALVGTFGLSFLLVLVGLLPVAWLNRAERRHARYLTALTLAATLAVFIWGNARLDPPALNTDTTLRLVQPSIPQTLKGTAAGQQEAVNELGRLSTQIFGLRDAKATIWSETAYPFTLRETTHLPLPKGIPLLLSGAVRAEGARGSLRLWNSLVAITAEGEAVATYDKHQLVPFGEFVPLRHLLPLEKITPGDIDYSRGDGPRTVAVAGLPPFSPLICYEAIFPWLAAEDAHRPDWLLNVTNDAWYGDSPGPYQHFAMARMRAIEQGVPLVRVANNGITALVDGRGVVLAQLALNQKAVLDVHLPLPLAQTFYAHHGDLPVVCALILLCLLFYLKLQMVKK